MKHLLLVFFNLFFLALPCVAKFSISQHYTVVNGLSNNSIHGVVQDSQGRIWIATESGLNCYDGYRFSCFKSHNSKLKSNFINTLYRDDKHQKIWIGVKGLGIYVIDEFTGEILDVTPQQMALYNVMSISPSSDDGVWLVSNNKIVYYSYRNAKFSLFLSSKTKEAYRMAVEDFQGNLVIVNYYDGLSLVDIRSKKPKKLNDTLKNIGSKYIYRLDTDNKKQMWIGSASGLSIYDFKTSRLREVHEMTDAPVMEIRQFGKYKLVATNSAVKMVEPSSLKVVFSEEIWHVGHIFVDNFGNFWLGTNANGIYFLGIANSPFKNVLPKSTWCLTDDGRKLWIGGYNRVYLLEGKQLKSEYPISFKGFNGNVLSIQNEDEQSVLLAVYGKLLRFSKQTGEVREVKCEGRSIFAITFYKDNDNVIWVTANNGIYSLRKGVVRYETELNKVLINQVTNAIRKDAAGKLWVGTIEHGLYVFDKAHRLIRHFTQSKSFFTNTVMHMYKGADNRLWLATSEGIGLFRNTLKSFDFEHFNDKQGLSDPFIRAMREDKNANVWVSTNNGLSYLNMKSHLFSNFNQNDGLPSNNFTGGMHIFPNGETYVTSLDGIISFNINYLTRKRKPSSIHFVKCVVLNASVEQMSEEILKESEGKIYHLNYDQNDIRLAFAVSNKAQSQQVDYSYKVDNMVEDWTMTDDNTITFRSLSPGKYTIRVRARLHGQNWDTSTATSMTLVIAQPWWWTVGARCLYICILLVSVYIYFHRYKHHLLIKNALELERRKNVVEQEFYQARLQFFTNITHELRTPLTLIVGPLEELLQSKHLCKEDSFHVNVMQKNVQRLLELVNRLMEFRKAETNNLQLVVSRGDFKNVITEIGNGFKNANPNPDVRYIIDVEVTSPYIYFDKNVIRSILSNLLNNASKYTQEGNIGISLSQVVKDSHQYSCVKIWDTGCGIDADALPHIFDRYYQVNSVYQAQGTGIGLALVKNLCKEHKIQIHVDSEVGRGTSFTLLLDNNETYQEALHQETSEGQMPASLECSHQDDKGDELSYKGHPTVLIVEDNCEINNYMAHSLKNDYYVLQALDGEQGFRLAKKMIPEIIICDIMMPVMDGFTMVQRIKSDIGTCHIPIIMLTAKNTAEDQQKCYEYGVSSFMSKPFSVHMLKTRILNLLEGQRKTADFILQKIKAEKEVGDDGNEQNKLSALDQKFLDKINQLIKDHISSEKLSLTWIAEQLKISQSTLYRKMKALTGVSGNEYIRKMRLNHSLLLMQEYDRNISEAAYESGFVDLAYFRTCFKEEFGELPSEYLKK